MYFLDALYLRRLFNFLQIGGLVLLSSCQSDPIVLNPPGSYEYFHKSFPINTVSAETVQGELHIGTSPRLYSGILLSGDTVSTLIKLLPQVLDSHQVCSTDSIADASVILTSTSPIALAEDTTFTDTLIQLNEVKAYLISSPQIDEDAIITSNDLTIISGLITDATSRQITLKTNYSLEIHLFEQENNIIDLWCGNQEELGIIVSYAPTDSSYLEFFSSDYNEVSSSPKLSVEYAVEEATSINYHRYSLNTVTWSDELIEDLNSGPYYVDDSLSAYWGTFYAISLNLDDLVIPNPPLNYDSISIQTDVISEDLISEGLNTFPLVQINVELNSEILSELDSISFSLINAFAFISEIDPEGDNWDIDTNPDGTDNNYAFDEGERYNDYGTDYCPDILEDGILIGGIGGCVVSEEESAFNSAGTEGNKQRDWIDYNGNGKWNDGEGEMWGDWGFDWCPDSLEDGNGNCFDTPPNNPLGYDPNGDNIDPIGDDWHAETNPGGTEGNDLLNWEDSVNENGVWDEGEGEKWYDWGIDGVSAQLPGVEPDLTEGNFAYDLGEPFHDTGSDGLFNIDEPGWNENRTEGNNEFDGEGEFSDCGVDNCCASDADEDKCDDDMDDNYNIDPNQDNWNDCGSDKICDEDNPDETEGNGIWDENEGMEKNLLLDWTDAEDENGVWDEGEGEEWFDWGLDGIHDTLEAFHNISVISPNLYENNYIFDLDDGEIQILPELVADTVSLWISEIIQTGNSLTIDVSVQTHIPLKGLQFQLVHTPYTRVDTILQTYQPSISQIGDEKLFEDFTLLPKKIYYEEELRDSLLIDYANDVFTFLDFDSLSLFLENSENIISHQYSNLVMYVDSASTDIHDDGMLLYITHINSEGDDEILLATLVASLSDSITIPMGQILRGYQHGSIGTYDGLQLKMGGDLYNYSRLSIQYNPEQSDFNPRLDLMYTK